MATASIWLVCAASCTAQPAVGGARRLVEFSGMCDASGAVELSPTRFAVADDEDNVLRIYDADRGGAPLAAVDLTNALGLTVDARKKKPKSPETDIEAATRIGDEAFWITSHGRNSKGKEKPERLRFFATNTPAAGDGAQEPIAVVGRVYEQLLQDLIAAPSLRDFDLAHAAELAPKAQGGLNIEGLTATTDGGLLVGFRNPNPNGRALIVPLLNPREVMNGEKPRFDAPLLLDLGGLGVRSLSYWRGRYLVIAGSFDGSVPSRLYTWKGGKAEVRPQRVEFRAFNPEAFFTPDARDEILLISDDGEVAIDGTPCKKLKDPARKRFRGAWVKLAR
jgi:hypothetical protein